VRRRKQHRNGKKDTEGKWIYVAREITRECVERGGDGRKKYKGIETYQVLDQVRSFVR
jgi:hypothetical protein